MSYNQKLQSIRRYPKEYFSDHSKAPEIDENFGSIAPYQNNTDKYKVFGTFEGQKLGVNDVNRLIDLEKNLHGQDDLIYRLKQEPFQPTAIDMYMLLDQRTRTESKFDPMKLSTVYNRKRHPDYNYNTRQNQF
jgi:hypothetical protein